ncbi:MAG: FtsX-like permease family protein [Candidatus Coatesbacteria bacterium]|nr:FtsX-like permease family protein [Candidatus Coatesbacteria bacterium]
MSLLGATMREATRIALDAIRSNKMRSFLTVLGIIIGVTVIITLVSIIQGMENAIAEQIGSLGSNFIMVTKEPAVQFGRPNPETWYRPELEFEDAEAIMEHCPDVQYASPINFTVASISHGGYRTNSMQIIGGNEYISRIYSLPVEHGRDFTPTDIQSRRRVVVLGAGIVESLFPNQDPLGREVRIGGHRFTVIGVLERRGEFFGMSQDDFVAIPYTTLDTTLEPLRSRQVTLEIAAISTSPATVYRANNQIETLMRNRRGLKPNEENNFEVTTQSGLLEVFEEITTVIYAIMVGVASISLLVGGIGIMNIMLVAVTERTREIGIRKALGARRRDILTQFVIESVILTLFGGAVGVGFGLLLAWGLGSLLELPNAVSVWAVGLGLGFSTFVGLTFGVFPAVKASRLDPIVALHYE